MKKIISLMVLMFLGSCFLGHPRGYVNQEIKNLASPNLIIEGMEYRRANGKVGFFPTQYKDDLSDFIGISDHGIIPDGLREKAPKYQQLNRLKVYYKSKRCLLFYLDNTVYSKYLDSFRKDKILALTKNGLELLTKDQYESAKDKYTINDKNVKCIKEE
jgi:hypothetical protein